MLKDIIQHSGIYAIAAFCVLTAGCVTYSIDAPEDKITGQINIHTPKPIKTISVKCETSALSDLGSEYFNPCVKILSDLEVYLNSGGYKVVSQNPDLSLRVSILERHAPLGDVKYFLGFISMYGLEYGTTTVAGLKARVIYIVEKQKAQKDYSLWDRSGSWDSLRDSLLTHISKDIEQITDVNK